MSPPSRWWRCIVLDTRFVLALNKIHHRLDDFLLALTRNLRVEHLVAKLVVYNVSEVRLAEEPGS